MLTQEDLKAISMIMDERFDQLEEKVDHLQESVEEIRTATNVLADWADRTSRKVKVVF